MLRGFGFGQASPIAAAAKASAAAANCPACAAGLTGGLIYAGSSGDDRYAFEPKRMNLQPRVGVAFRATSKLVFRGGYGLSYLGQSASGQQVGFSRSTPLVASTDGNLKPAASLSDPYPTSIYPGGLLQPIGSSQGLATNLGQSVTAQYLDRPLPYSHQYSAGFQYQLPGNWLIDASYVGNITRRLPISLNLNFVPLDVQNSHSGGPAERVLQHAGRQPDGRAGPQLRPEQRDPDAGAVVLRLPAVQPGDHYGRADRLAALRLRAVQGDQALLARLHHDRRVHRGQGARADLDAQRAGRERYQPVQLHSGKAADSVRCAAPALHHRHLRPALR